MKDKLLEYILTAEREKANQLLTDWGEKHTYKQALLEILNPVLLQIGKLWHTGKVSLAQGYVASKVTEDIFKKIIQFEMDSVTHDSSSKIAVIGNAEDDYHALGRKMVSIFLQTANWKVIDLGNDVSAEEFVDACVLHKAQIIGVSAMMFTTAMNIKKIRNLLNERNLSSKIKLAVGGAIFLIRKDLVYEVGADGTTDNAMNAPQLFDELLEKLGGSVE